MSHGRFKIGTLATLTGIGIPTLRNWERRYGLFKPSRAGSGHRLYTDDDLAILRRIQGLLYEGRSIGEVAALGREALLAHGAKATVPASAAEALSGSLPYFVLDALPCGVLLTDLRGRTLWVNKSCERICGYGLAELRGQTPGSVLQGPDTDPTTVRKIAEAVARLRACRATILNYDNNARAYWADLEISPLLVGAEARGFVATVRDVTDEVERRASRR